MITAIVILVAIVFIDTMQARAFGNAPFIKVVEDYNGGDVYQKHKGLLVDTYIFTDDTSITLFKWEEFEYSI